MPIIEDTPEYQVIETVTPNGRTVQTVFKPGSRGANRETLLAKAQQALATNGTYLGHAALPGGSALTTTQLTTIIRVLSAEVDALAKQNNALIRMALGLLDDVSDT